MRLILAIDQGTGSSKALLVDRQGEIVAKGSAPLGRSHPQPGWVEQSLDDIWASIQRAVADAMRAVDPAKVAAVGLSTQRESLVLWDRESGKPVGPLISWQDQRTAQACQDLIDAAPVTQVRRSQRPTAGSDVLCAPRPVGCWTQHDPDRARPGAANSAWAPWTRWLLSRFGGDHVIEIGNASRTQLLNVRERPLGSRTAGSVRHTRTQCCPSVVPRPAPSPRAAGLVGTTRPLRRSGRVMGDSHAALFAHAAWQPGTGQGDVRNRVLGDGHLSTQDRRGERALSDHRLAGRRNLAYAVEGNIRASGATLDLVGQPPRQSRPAQLAELAEHADSDGVAHRSGVQRARRALVGPGRHRDHRPASPWAQSCLSSPAAALESIV